jgi:hypothetical protein
VPQEEPRQNLRRASVFSFRTQDHNNPLHALDSVDTVNELVEQIDSYYGLPLNKQVTTSCGMIVYVCMFSLTI